MADADVLKDCPKKKRYQIISVITSLRQENKKLQEQICKQNLS